MKRIWWLNFDAERELANPSARAPGRRVIAQMWERAQRFAPDLCQDDPFLVPGVPAKELARGLDAAPRVLFWCPTPGAIQATGALGLPGRPCAPALDVLRKVNDRRFAAVLWRKEEFRALENRLAEAFPATSTFTDATQWFPAAPFALAFSDTGFGKPSLPALSVNPPGERPAPYRLKRFFGFAGRSQRRIEGWAADVSGPRGTLDPETERWLRGAKAQGGYLAEPDVEVLLELSLHGLVTETALLLGEPCLQRCDAFGAPVSITRATTANVPTLLHECLRDGAAQVARALRQAGYFGPFGIDARLFRWQETLGVHLIGDLNARFTLGWSIGMAEQRETALQVLLERMRVHS